MNLENNPEYTIMKNKVTRMLQNADTSVKKSIVDFKKLADNIEDTIFTNGEYGRLTFQKFGGIAGILVPTLYDNQILRPLTIHNNALGQITEKLGIKSGVVQNYLGGDEWQKELAIHMLNQHSQHDNNRYLARVVGNEIRGFLSDRYKRFDSGKIVAQFLVSGSAAGLLPISSNVSDTRIYFESIIPQVFAIPTAKNGVSYVVFGARISISDFGDGALNVSQYMLQVACWNGMTKESILRQIHRGGKIESDFEISQRTFELETAARSSAVADLMRSSFSRDTIAKEVSLIQKASERNIKADDVKPFLTRNGMYVGEIKMLEDYLKESRLEDGVAGELSLWKLAQSVGAVARDVDEVRMRELHELAGQIFTKGMK